ncbi:MAG: carbohydrate ABC transporter permease [Chloroflexota bacterium]|nr:carbohydrate ABC transporter permease [Chloroflexota bacterium]
MTSRWLGALVTYVGLGLILVIVLAPFGFMVLSSLKTNLDVLEVPPNLNIFDLAVIRKNYDAVLNQRNFLTYMKNSIVVVAGSTFLALVIGTPAAYGFSRFTFRGREDLAFWILSNRFMPVVAIAVPIYLMMANLQALDTYQGLILPYVAIDIPLVVWLMRGFFDEVSREIDDAALIDGCNRWQALGRVLLPLSAPGLVTTAILCAIFTWNEFLLGLFVVSTGASQTTPVGASGLLTMERSIEWNVTSTVGVVTVIPVLVFALLIQRHIVRGLTAGAVK